MILKKDYLQRLINEEFAKVISKRKKNLTETTLADDDDVGGAMRGRCLGCGAEEEDCQCGPELTEPCPKCGSENTTSTDPAPSMMGHGSDTGIECLDCGVVSMDNPLMPKRWTEGKNKLSEGPYGRQATGSSLTDLANRIIELETSHPGALEAALNFDNAPDLDEVLSWLSNFDDGGPDLQYETPSTTGDFMSWNGTEWVSSDDDDDEF